MSGNTTGKMFKVTTFGSSHGTALGAIVDGCPAGLKLSRQDIQEELDRRRPGTSKITTPRSETDQVEILSGIFQGRTDGAPITAVTGTWRLHMESPLRPLRLPWWRSRQWPCDNRPCCWRSSCKKTA